MPFVSIPSVQKDIECDLFVFDLGIDYVDKIVDRRPVIPVCRTSFKVVQFADEYLECVAHWDLRFCGYRVTG